MTFSFASRRVRAGHALVALLSVLPPVGFGFCATPGGHFEIHIFDSAFADCGAVAAPCSGSDECETASRGSCSDVAVLLQEAIRIGAQNDGLLDFSTASVPTPAQDSTYQTSRRLTPLQPVDRPVAPPALDTTLLRP